MRIPEVSDYFKINVIYAVKKLVGHIQQNDKENFKKLGNNAFEYTKKNHDVKIIIEQFKTALYQLANESA